MTTAPYWIDAFVESLGKRPALKDVEIFPVMVSDSTLKARGSSIRIAGVSHNEQAASLGRGARDEDYRVSVALRASAAGGGKDVAIRARNAAYALMREIQEELREHSRYDVAEGTITYAEVVGAEYSANVSTNERSASIDVDVNVRARYP